MADIDVAPEHLRLVLEALRRHVPDHEVWAFGSRLHRAKRPTSDLDLVLRGPRVPPQRLAALRHRLEDGPLPFPVDLLEWDALADGFRRIIEADHIVIQEPSRRAAADAKRIDGDTGGPAPPSFRGPAKPEEEAGKRP